MCHTKRLIKLLSEIANVARSSHLVPQFWVDLPKSEIVTKSLPQNCIQKSVARDQTRKFQFSRSSEVFGRMVLLNHCFFGDGFYTNTIKLFELIKSA